MNELRPIKTIYYTTHFERSFKRLPATIKALAEQREIIFRKNAFDPRLGTPSLKENLSVFGRFRSLDLIGLFPHLKMAMSLHSMTRTITGSINN